jgi:hypothetical protein
MTGDELTYEVEPDPVPGVQQGYLYLHHGREGEAWCIPVAALVDLDGVTHYQQTGEARVVHIVDDTPPPFG